MSKITILIGLPGSGKSTWRAKNQKNDVVISLDDILDKIALQEEITYPEAFSRYANDAAKLSDARFKNAVSRKQNILVDKTNMSVKSRAKFLDFTKDYDEKIAIIFSLPEPELKLRLRKRAEMTGKIIPDSVIDDMARKYEAPSKKEGFTKIVRIK